MNGMAYLRREKETVEIAYPLERVWATISGALKDLDWTIEEVDDVKYHIKAKTKKSIVSWGSELLIELAPVDENTTKLSVAAETPVTTVSSIVDFGRTRQRIDLFLTTMARQLTNQPNRKAKEQDA